MKPDPFLIFVPKNGSLYLSLICIMSLIGPADQPKSTFEPASQPYNTNGLPPPIVSRSKTFSNLVSLIYLNLIDFDMNIKIML